MVVAFAPIAAFLLGVTNVSVPWETLLLSTLLYVVLPLTAGVVTRSWLQRRSSQAVSHLVSALKPWSIVGLIATVVLLFGFQAQTIINKPLVIGLIAIPLVLQTYGIFFLSWWMAKAIKLPHTIAGPACLIGTSNFFELASGRGHLLVRLALWRGTGHGGRGVGRGAGHALSWPW